VRCCAENAENAKKNPPRPRPANTKNRPYDIKLKKNIETVLMCITPALCLRLHCHVGRAGFAKKFSSLNQTETGTVSLPSQGKNQSHLCFLSLRAQRKYFALLRCKK
jgi:hypothetical protein